MSKKQKNTEQRSIKSLVVLYTAIAITLLLAIVGFLYYAFWNGVPWAETDRSYTFNIKW